MGVGEELEKAVGTPVGREVGTAVGTSVGAKVGNAVDPGSVSRFADQGGTSVKLSRSPTASYWSEKPP